MGSALTLTPTQKQLLTKQNMGGRKHINPLKRTNSQNLQKDPISDNYSFYMFHIKDKKKERRPKSDLEVDPAYQTTSQK